MHCESNLITVQQDATCSVYYISVGSSTCFGCWHPSSGAGTAVITASDIDWLQWGKYATIDTIVYNLTLFQPDATCSVYYISVGSSTCFGCWHPSSAAGTAVITASGIDWLQWVKYATIDSVVYNFIIFQQDATYSVYYITVGSSTCFGCWHPSSGAGMAVITASGIDWLQWVKYATIDTVLYNLTIFQPDVTCSVYYISVGSSTCFGCWHPVIRSWYSCNYSFRYRLTMIWYHLLQLNNEKGWW